MARNWPRLPLYQTREQASRVAPQGWAVYQIEELFDKVPIGRRFEQKTCFPVGAVPVLDQSAEGFVGWHNEEPGVHASAQRPIVTFANHTCEMRLMRRSFSVIQNVLPMVGRAGVCETAYLYYATKGRVHLEEYKGHYPIYRGGWVAIPPIEQQVEAVELLGALDDKIELNRRMNGTLEALAQAVFKEWFVEKAEEGWAQQPLEAHYEVGRGLSYTSASLSDGEGLPMHNLNTVEEGGGYKYRGIKWYTGEYKDRHVVVPGDLVVTNVEQGFEYLLIGYGALVPKRFGERGLFSQDLCRLRPVKGSYLSAIYLYFLLRTPYFHDLVVGYSNGTTVNHLAIDGLRKPEFRVPPKKLHDAFVAQVQPMLERMELNEDENVTLAALRDTLLPKLMRGEVRVKNAVVNHE